METSYAAPLCASSDAQVLAELQRASHPVISIRGASRVDWKRVMRAPGDPRIGPWKWHAHFDVLDHRSWNRLGEVLYFVTDLTGTVRVVGQSSSRLKGRWKEVPMSFLDGTPMKRRALFHTTAWPAIEAELEEGRIPQYQVRAIFGDEIESLSRRIGGPLAEVLERPRTPLHGLSYHVETWICGLKRHGHPLWNKQKT